jgi:hypothetical protein
MIIFFSVLRSLYMCGYVSPLRLCYVTGNATAAGARTNTCALMYDACISVRYRYALGPEHPDLTFYITTRHTRRLPDTTDATGQQARAAVSPPFLYIPFSHRPVVDCKISLTQIYNPAHSTVTCVSGPLLYMAYLSSLRGIQLVQVATTLLRLVMSQLKPLLFDSDGYVNLL